MGPNSCTTHQELIGIVTSPTIYEHVTIGSSHFIIVLKDQEPVSSCSIEKSIFSSTSYTAQTQSTEFRKLRIIYTKGKKFYVAEMLSRSFSKYKLHLIK